MGAKAFCTVMHGTVCIGDPEKGNDVHSGGLSRKAALGKETDRKQSKEKAGIWKQNTQ